VACECLDAVSVISSLFHERIVILGREVRGRKGEEEDKEEEERTYPLETSQTLIVLSRLAETNLSPSCVNLTVDIL
jgi:hypothetical protein